MKHSQQCFYNYFTTTILDICATTQLLGTIIIIYLIIMILLLFILYIGI
jgi:hypothetical protein